MRKITTLMSMLFIFSSIGYAGRSTVEEVMGGKSCKDTSSQSIECEYKVGKDLLINIAGIGQNDASITFMKSDFDGDYYASIGIKHGCVIVKRGPKSIDNSKTSGAGSFIDFAFISPKTGKVYSDWSGCQTGR